MNLLRKCLVFYLAAAMFVIGITPRVYAGFSPSEALNLSPSERSSDLRKIQKFLETKKVGERLKELGLTPEEIQARLHQLSLKIDDLKAGGDEFLGVIILLLVIAIVVIVILQLTGHRIIIK